MAVHFLAPFELGRLYIDPAPNGGFVVSLAGELGSYPKILGAFSSAAHMIEAMSHALVVEDQPQVNRENPAKTTSDAEVSA